MLEIEGGREMNKLEIAITALEKITDVPCCQSSDCEEGYCGKCLAVRGLIAVLRATK